MHTALYLLIRPRSPGYFTMGIRRRYERAVNSGSTGVQVLQGDGIDYVQWSSVVVGRRFKFFGRDCQHVGDRATEMVCTADRCKRRITEAVVFTAVI